MSSDFILKLKLICEVDEIIPRFQTRKLSFPEIMCSPNNVYRKQDFKLTFSYSEDSWNDELCHPPPHPHVCTPIQL